LGWVEYTKKKVVCQRKSITRYDSPLLMLLRANRATRRTLMITDNQQIPMMKNRAISTLMTGNGEGYG